MIVGDLIGRVGDWLDRDTELDGGRRAMWLVIWAALAVGAAVGVVGIVTSYW